MKIIEQLLIKINFQWYVKYINWKYRRFSKCEICHRSLFRHGTHGAFDFKDGNKKRTVYVCGLCYHLFNKLK